MRIFTLTILLFMCLGLSAQTATAPSFGDGSSGNPYQIATLENLYWIAANVSNWNKNYIQTANIDAAATQAWFPITGGGYNGWTPIGNDTNLFTGTYNGDNKTISNLYINRTGTSNVGLFGSASGATLRNIRISNASVSGGDNWIGILAGKVASATSVSNCHSSGTAMGRSNLGGLIGYATGSSVLISNSSSSATVVGNNVAGAVYTGGLIGHINSSATVQTCFASGNVSGRNRVGGLLGAMGWNSLLQNSYATGNVTLSDPLSYIGGLVGEVYRAKVKNSYSNGYVNYGTATGNYGGLVGVKNTGGNFLDQGNYWDMTTSGLSTSAMGTGKSSAAMTSYSTYTDWDFIGDDIGTDIWNIGNDRNNGYPYLVWQFPGDSATLPVELSVFTATFTAQGYVTIKWVTQSETNCQGYYVYRGLTQELANAQIVSPLVPAMNTSSQQNYLYEDQEINQSGLYYYWLQSVDIDGSFHFYGSVSVFVLLNDNNTNPQIPLFTTIQNVYPNPFNTNAFIRYDIQKSSPVSIQIYNVRGQLLREYQEGMKAPDRYTLIWDGKDQRGISCPSGVYTIRLLADKLEETQKVILQK